MAKKMLRAREVAELLGLHPRTVVRLVHDGQLSGSRIGGVTLIPIGVVEGIIGEQLVVKRPRADDQAA